jgi:hypothetical protein
VGIQGLETDYISLTKNTKMHSTHTGYMPIHLPPMKIPLIAAEFSIIESKELNLLMLDTIAYQLIRG